MAAMGVILIGTPVALADRAVSPARLAISAHTSCSKAEQKRRTARLAAFKRQMAKTRKDYFRHHRSVKSRRLFVKRQNARLAALKRSVSACRSIAPEPSAELAIAVADPGAIPLGAGATYVATIKNNGPAAAQAVSVDETSLDAALTLEAAVASRGSCSLITGQPTCSLGTLAAGTSTTVSFVVTPGHVGSNPVEVAVRSSTSDPRLRNNSSVLPLKVVDSADLAVEGTTSPQTAFPGKRVTQSFVVVNRGTTAAAQAAEFVDALPPGLRFLFAVASRGTCAGNAIVRCDVGFLVPGERATVTIFAKALATGAQTSSVSVGSTTADPNAGNNALTLATEVEAPAPLPPPSAGPACAPSIAATGNPTPYTEGSSTDYGFFLRPLGTVHGLMIFVDFPDAPQSASTQSLFDALVPSAEEWYADGSYGRTALAVDSVNLWFRMPKPSGQYGIGPGLMGPAQHAYIADAIAAADSFVNFHGYDAVYIVPSAGAAIDGTFAYVVNPGSGVFADGAEIRHAVTLDPHSIWPGIIDHETGHLFGLPDLYQAGVPYHPDGVRAVGGWDPMSEHYKDLAAQFSGWHKLKLGWLDATQVRCVPTPGTSLEETLSPLETSGGVKLIVVPTGTTTATVVEVRQPIGADEGLCDSGVLVYAIDGSIRTGETPLRIRRVGTGTDAMLDLHCGGPYDAPLDLGPGEVSTYDDAAVKVTVLATDGASYRVRVTKK